MPRPGLLLVIAALSVVSTTRPGASDELACLDVKLRLLGEHERVCVSALDDPRVPGVTCYVSHEKSGGVSEKIGLERPSRYAMACRQVGPIAVDLATLPPREQAFSLDKQTQIFRIVDDKRKVLVYLAVSARAAQGSLRNIVSTVPLMPWGSTRVTDR